MEERLCKRAQIDKDYRTEFFIQIMHFTKIKDGSMHTHLKHLKRKSEETIGKQRRKAFQ
jgi:hypothetical protein